MKEQPNLPYAEQLKIAADILALIVSGGGNGADALAIFARLQRAFDERAEASRGQAEH